MATLKPTLTLTNADSTADALNISVTDTLTVSEPAVNIARASIATSAATSILTTANSAITYVYLKNIDTTNIITVKNDNNDNFLDLGPGEFSFFPVKGAIGLKAQANTAACVLEYGYWSKS